MTSSLDESVRCEAARLLADSDSEGDLELLLLRLAQENSRRVQTALFEVLSAMPAPLRISHGMSLLDSDSPFVRNQMVELLQKRCAEQSEELLAYMAETSARVRKLLVDIAAGCPWPKVQALYSAALQDGDVNVRLAALEGLGGHRARQYKKQVESVLESACDPMVLVGCLQALGSLGDAQSVELALGRFAQLETQPAVYQLPLIQLVGAQGLPEHASLLTALLGLQGSMAQEKALSALLRVRRRFKSSAFSDTLVQQLCLVDESMLSELARYDYWELLQSLSALEPVKLRLQSCRLEQPEEALSQEH